MSTFEEGFALVEREAAIALKALAALTSATRQLHKAAVEGDIGRIRRTSERVPALLSAAQRDLDVARAAWPFGPPEEEAYLATQYEGELQAFAASQGLSMRAQDRRLIVFPVVLRVIPGERAIKVDRRKVARLRPTHLVAELKNLQGKKPRFPSERFLEVLYRAYRLLGLGREPGRTEALARVYEALTLLPGLGTDYDEMDFCRDLFQLDRSGIERTKNGARVNLPVSAGTKGGKTFRFMAPDGELVTYYGIRFQEAGRG